MRSLQFDQLSRYMDPMGTEYFTNRWFPCVSGEFPEFPSQQLSNLGAWGGSCRDEIWPEESQNLSSKKSRPRKTNTTTEKQPFKRCIAAIKHGDFPLSCQFSGGGRVRDLVKFPPSTISTPPVVSKRRCVWPAATRATRLAPKLRQVWSKPRQKGGWK